MLDGLVIENLTRPGLHPTSLRVGKGKCVVIHGPSGSGKSLFLRAVADLDPNNGHIALNGETRAMMSAPEWRKKAVYLQPESAWWHDIVGAHFTHLPAAKTLAEAFGLYEPIFDWPTSRLSTGERQRLSLAMVLASKPPLLLLDEPTSALGQKQQMEVLKTIKKVQRLGNIAIILITHNEIHARLIADRFTFLSLGEVIGSGLSSELGGVDVKRLMAGGAEIGDLAKELEL